MKTRQRGSTVLGVIVGLVLGLGVALAVAVYVTKVPVPFLNKTQRGGPEQDEAEARKNRDWDPNAPLAGKNAPRPAPPPTSSANSANSASSGTLNAPAAPGKPAPPAPAVATPSKPATATEPLPRAARAPVPAEVKTASAPSTSSASADPLGDLARARSGSGDPFLYFVQAGAFRTQEDAESQRAKLSLMGVQARVTEREQSGRTVFRVRAGPFETKDAADTVKSRLDNSGLDSALVRVQR